LSRAAPLWYISVMQDAASSATWNFMRQRWLMLGFALFLGVVHVQYMLKLTHSETGMRSAFLRWRVQLAALNDGVNVWEKYAYPNPPIMAMILKPFMALPPALGASLWFACKGLMALAAVLAVLALPWGGGRGGGRAPPPGPTRPALESRPTFHGGQNSSRLRFAFDPSPAISCMATSIS
jgi:hypothetical protein